MIPQEFISKWRNVELKERRANQSHFLDLCRLLAVDDPVTADPKGEWFTFEKGASKTSGGEGWADVWRKDCFAWEYKGKNKIDIPHMNHGVGVCEGRVSWITQRVQACNGQIGWTVTEGNFAARSSVRTTALGDARTGRRARVVCGHRPDGARAILAAIRHHRAPPLCT